jgi:uncharacterized protein (DUF4415 family)
LGINVDLTPIVFIEMWLYLRYVYTLQVLHSHGQIQEMKSKTDVAALKASKKPPVLTEEHPELDMNYVVKKVVRMGLKPLPPKTSISLRVDQDVLDWFKSQGDGYQTRINAVLRAFRDASVYESMT